jgi:hypothetical protein
MTIHETLDCNSTQYITRKIHKISNTFKKLPLSLDKVEDLFEGRSMDQQPRGAPPHKATSPRMDIA